MISPHAHIAMTYQPPAPEPQHVHRVEKQRKQIAAKPSRRLAIAQRLHLAPRQAYHA
jgi:hypothetical protein